MEQQAPSSEANISTLSHEIPRILRTQNIKPSLFWDVTQRR